MLSFTGGDIYPLTDLPTRALAPAGRPPAGGCDAEGLANLTRWLPPDADPGPGAAGAAAALEAALRADCALKYALHRVALAPGSGPWAPAPARRRALAAALEENWTEARVS